MERTELLSKALTGIAGAVLLPRLPELFLVSNKSGRRAFVVQAVALALLKLRSVKKLSLLDKVRPFISSLSIPFAGELKLSCRCRENSSLLAQA